MIIDRYEVIEKSQVIVLKLGLEKSIIQKLEEDILSLPDAQNKSTNVKAYMSTWNLWDQIDIKPLMDKIEPIIEDKSIVSFNRFPPGAKIEDYPTIFNNIWSAVYKKGDYTVPHAHTPSSGSFVYYVKAENDAAPLIFSFSDFAVPALTDTLVIFPGYMTHEVPPLLSDESRIVIAGNFSRYS
jgi:hypothetical protein